jgi:polyketide cyclase/dehydrase/lipid transport protein
VATFEHSVVIGRPVEEVFAFLARTENETQWQEGLVESRQTSDGPMGVGATGEDVRTSMGRRMVTAWTCTGFEPNRGFEFKVTKPIPFYAAYRFEEVPGGTRVEIRAQPTGFSRLLWPLIARLGRKQYETNFAALKKVLEAQP